MHHHRANLFSFYPNETLVYTEEVVSGFELKPKYQSLLFHQDEAFVHHTADEVVMVVMADKVVMVAIAVAVAVVVVVTEATAVTAAMAARVTV